MQTMEPCVTPFPKFAEVPSNKGRGYENPSLEIIVTERCLIGGCPLKEAYEHFFLNQSVIYVVVLISLCVIVEIMLDILLLFFHF